MTAFTNVTTSNWDKFVLLLWKNLIIQKRHYIQTFFEIAVPVLCCSILLLLRGLVDPEFVEKSTVFNPLLTDHSVGFRIPEDVTLQVAYSPQSPLLERIVGRAAKSLNVTYLGLPNARSLESTLVDSNILVGVEFEDSLASAASLPEKLTFALRFPGELRTSYSNVFPNWETRLLMVPFSPQLRNPYDDFGGYPEYYQEGFLNVQTAISKSIIKEFNANVELPEVFINRYPYPPYYDDPILQAMEQLLSMIILLSFFYPCVVMVKHITMEKEKQLKEAMKIMGLPNWLHWSAWFVKNILLLTVSISLITILICVSLNNFSILEYSDWTCIWFFLFVYSITTVCFCFMMSVFFNKANIASGIAGLMWFVFVMPFNVTAQSYDTLSTNAKLGLSLFSNSAMSFGILGTIRKEANQQGIQWDTLFTPATIDDGLSMGLMIVMLLIDAVIYLAIAMYVEQVRPGEFGVAKPWYFLFQKEFWVKNQVTVSDVDHNGVENQSSRFFEAEPTSSNAGIQIKNLRKVFNGNKVAVQGLNLKMYEDQITVLLGHNGAGKTTTMSMLTGMFSPTSGTAYLNGYDIRNNIEGVRQSMGLCPQHNVLFDEITVSEHLRFFARLKGVQKAHLDEEVEKGCETKGRKTYGRMDKKSNAKRSKDIKSNGQKVESGHKVEWTKGRKWKK